MTIDSTKLVISEIVGGADETQNSVLEAYAQPTLKKVLPQPEYIVDSAADEPVSGGQRSSLHQSTELVDFLKKSN